MDVTGAARSRTATPPGGRPMRVGLLTAWASRANGGVFEAVVAHAELLRARGFDPVVFALDDEFGAADEHRFGRTLVHRMGVVGPAAVGYAPALLKTLIAADLDLLHLHGIWMYPSHAGARWSRRTGRPYVISPHGMLDPWITSRGRAKKAVAEWGYERQSWRTAALFHALTEREAEDIVAYTGADSVAVVPNVVMPGQVRTGVPAPVVLSLGRIHPKKNTEALVHAWVAARDVLQPLGARLQIVGWGDAAHVAALEQVVAAAGGNDIDMLGPVFGDGKAKLLHGARYLALPSHSEGLPLAILEAWGAGTPTLMSRHCNVDLGFDRGAAMDCGTSIETIAGTLRAAFTLPAIGWQAMSDAALALVEVRYSPSQVGDRWAGLYARLIASPAEQAA